MGRLAALQKRCVPFDYGGAPHQGAPPMISMADLVRWVVTIGLDRAEGLVGVGSKKDKKGGAR